MTKKDKVSKIKKVKVFTQELQSMTEDFSGAKIQAEEYRIIITSVCWEQRTAYPVTIQW